MTIVEALKAFYKNSVEDIKKLNDADSVLEVLRAKYGDYKGSNVSEYVQELVENGISPGGGGGGGDLTTAEVTIISESAIDVDAYLPIATDIPDAEFPASEGHMFIPFGETVVCNAIMFKGVCFLQLATTSIIIKSVDGDVTKTSIDTAMIEGNCTIIIGDAY